MVFASQQTKTNQIPDFDVVGIGGGFSGLYLIHAFREAGFSVKTFETGEDVGGVWYWHRYPGLRCDVESIAYCYLFSKELYQEWTWSSRYPSQPEILRYLNYVADKFDLRKDIQFNKRITSAHYDEMNGNWRIYLDDDTSVTAKYFIPTVGGLSAALNVPNFKGIDNFNGKWYHTGNWPKEKVDFKDQNVGVIGTGASGIQVIPQIAEQAEQLTVFQRTPQYTVPARDHALDPDYVQQIQSNFDEIKRQIRNSKTGDFKKHIDKSALEATNEERLQEFEEGWRKGSLPRYNDMFTNEESNETYGKFIRSKIADIVDNPEIAEKLMPNFLYGTKRIPLCTNYYETFNKDNVDLVDVKNAPIEEITPRGVRTSEQEYELDTLVFATGYDAVTGPLFKMDIRGRNGITLQDKWDDGGQIKTYLGLSTTEFPNLFFVAGPETPAAFVNNIVVVETGIEWIVGCIKYLRKHNINMIEAKKEAEANWSKTVTDIAYSTLIPRTKSWWTGANISGKPESFPHYLGGFNNYRQICLDVANKNYEGFSLFANKDGRVNS